MDLPPELRHRIYGYAVTSAEALLFPSVCKHTSAPLSAQPSITRVCRQMRKEALPLFYVLNKFEAHVYTFDFSYFIKHAKLIQAAGIHKMGPVEFGINVNCSSNHLGCFDDLEPMVLWFATNNLDIVQWMCRGEMREEDEGVMNEILGWAENTNDRSVKKGKSSKKARQAVRRDFRDVLKENAWKHGDRCYDWCSKDVGEPEHGWVCDDGED